MKITIDTTAKNIEAANFILAAGIRSLRENPRIIKDFDITMQTVERAERFRNKLLKGFLKPTPCKS